MYIYIYIYKIYLYISATVPEARSSLWFLGGLLGCFKGAPRVPHHTASPCITFFKSFFLVFWASLFHLFLVELGALLAQHSPNTAPSGGQDDPTSGPNGTKMPFHMITSAIQKNSYFFVDFWIDFSSNVVSFWTPRNLENGALAKALCVFSQFSTFCFNINFFLILEANMKPKTLPNSSI